MKKEELSSYTIVIENFQQKIKYDGSQILAHYTAEEHGVLGNSILLFRGNMELSPKEMVDIKNVLRESHLAKVLISSNDALHMIIEEFDIQPPNLEIAYYRLRMLTQLIIEQLQLKGVEVSRNGTDLFINEKKLNVGIATISQTSCKIHFGLNYSDTGIPSHVNAIGLKKLGFTEQDLEEWLLTVAKKYIKEISKIKNDVVKTKPI